MEQIGGLLCAVGFAGCVAKLGEISRRKTHLYFNPGVTDKFTETIKPVNCRAQICDSGKAVRAVVLDEEKHASFDVRDESGYVWSKVRNKGKDERWS